MSMLAEPKRKQKWMLNSRGKSWSEDSNKFGQKMLEKMGWSNGKGLGAQEQGMLEHIRVKIKNDQVGIGFDKDRNDQWSENQESFGRFLQHLQNEQLSENAKVNEDNNLKLSGKSLEEKSKKSQKRVHYKKFIRSKDVNKYSPKDLANIFGKKDLNEKYVKEEENDNIEKENEIYDPIGTQNSEHGIITIKAGNMNDYFKSKITPGIEKNASSQENDYAQNDTTKYNGFGYSAKSKSKFYINSDATSPINEDSESESERYAGFGFSKNKKVNNLNYVFDNPCLDLNILDDNSSVPQKLTEFSDKYSNKIKQKKRKHEFTCENDNKLLECSKKSIKKKKSDFTYENEGLVLGFSDNPVVPIKDVSEPISQEDSLLNLTLSNKKVPKTSKKINNEALTNDNEDYASNIDYSNKIKLKHGKKNEGNILSNGFDNFGLDLEFPEKLIKKKQEDEGLVFSDNPVVPIKDVSEPISQEDSLLNLTLSNKKVPKKSKKINNDALTNDNEDYGLNIDSPKKIKSKQDSKKNEGNILSNGFDNFGLDLEFPEKVKPKKPKRNKNVLLLKQDDECNTLNIGSVDNTDLRNIRQEDVLSAEEDNFERNIKSRNPIRSIDIDKERDVEPELAIAYKNSKVDLDHKDRTILKKKKTKACNDIEMVDTPTAMKTKKCKKNRALSSGIENQALDLNMLEMPKEEEIYSIVDESDRIEKKHCCTLEYEVPRAQNGMENSALDLSDENTNKKRVTFNSQIEYSSDTPMMKNKKKKKKKKKKKQSKKLDKYEVTNDKLKKASKTLEPLAFTNEVMDEEVNLEELDNELNERKSKKSKRKKRQRISLLETIDEIPEEEHLDKVTAATVEHSSGERNSRDNEVSEISIEDVQAIPGESSDKKKKKKHKKNKETDVTAELMKVDEAIVVNRTAEEELMNSEQQLIVRKKNKDAKNKECTGSLEVLEGVDRKAMEDIRIDSEEMHLKDKTNLMDNNERRIKRVKKKKKDADENYDNEENVYGHGKEGNLNGGSIKKLANNEGLTAECKRQCNDSEIKQVSMEPSEICNQVDGRKEENTCSHSEDINLRDGSIKATNGDGKLMEKSKKKKKVGVVVVAEPQERHETSNEFGSLKKKEEEEEEEASISNVIVEPTNVDDGMESLKMKPDVYNIDNWTGKREKLKETKQMIKELFLKNPILMFKGSNINEIKGYGFS